MSENKKDVEIISLIGLAHSISHFFHLIIAPLFPWIKVEFDLSYAELGLLMTTFYVVSSIVQTTSGMLVDRYGPRPLLYCGIFFLMISALVLGIAQSYTMLLVGVSIAGFGNGVFHPVDFTMINHLVKPKNLPHAYSVHGVTGYLGWAVAPLFLLGLTALFDSWRYAQFGAAALAGVVFVILILRRKQLDDPVGQEDVREPELPIATLAIFKLPSVWMSWLFFYLSSFGFAGVQIFASTALVDIYDIPISLTTSSYTLFMICSALGMIAGGFVATRIPDPDRVITSAFLISGLMAIVAGLGVLPGWTVPAIFALMGFGGGMAGPARDLMVRAGTPKGASGRIFGLVYSGMDFGAASGPLLFGMIMDWKSPAIIFYAIALLQILAIFVAVALNQHNKKQGFQTA